MTFDRIEGAEPDKTLKLLVQKFSRLEGRQPRAMVCRKRESEAYQLIQEISVDLAGFGFDVDIGIPFDSFFKLGMNAIENDADLLILFGLEGNSSEDFVTELNEFLSEKGYSDLLILVQHRDFSLPTIIEELIKWLGQGLQ